jgi:hypothetical protein
MKEWWCSMVCPQQGWIFKNPRTHLNEGICVLVGVDERKNVIEIGRGVRLIM